MSVTRLRHRLPSIRTTVILLMLTVAPRSHAANGMTA
jgi:hypothetical protein